MHLLDEQQEEILTDAALTRDLSFVEVLGSILAWLQQKPCRKSHSSSDMKSLPWYCIASTLRSSVCFIADAKLLEAAQARKARLGCYAQLNFVKGSWHVREGVVFMLAGSLRCTKLAMHALSPGSCFDES